MKATNITLLFNGQTEEAFNFYQSVFGGAFSNLQRMKDIPSASAMPEAEANKILYMALPLGHTLLAGMDIPASQPPVKTGQNFIVSLDTESEAETTELFNKLIADGGQVMMPLDRQFWSDYFGMLTDRFGIQWMLSYVKG